MKKRSITPPNPKRGVVSRRAKELYARRDPAQDNADPDAPVLGPEMWAEGEIGKFYRPKKTPVTVRVDNDVLAWLRSKGQGHLTRINAILRESMRRDRA